MKERKPKAIVMQIELEDNVGAVIAKKKIEIPVPVTANATELLDNFIQRLQAEAKKLFDGKTA